MLRRSVSGFALILTLTSSACGDSGKSGADDTPASGEPEGRIGSDASIAVTGSGGRDAAVIDLDAKVSDAAPPSASNNAPATGLAAVVVDGATAQHVTDAATTQQADASAQPDAGDLTLADASSEPATPDASAASEPDAGTAACDPSVAPRADQLAYQVIVSNETLLSNLTFAAQAPDSEDWYLVEMTGQIWRVRNGALDTTPFLDLSSAISLGAGYDQTSIGYDERGLVGLAFAPDYPTSGLFYVTITPSATNFLGLTVDHDMVIEYRLPGDGAAPQLSRILVEVPSAFGLLGNIHNMNTVRFGPDGLLYVGMGDGGGVNCGDSEPNASQDVGSVFGKILRLDLSQPAPYAALDNPFVGSGDARVWQYGLRNPFRFSFDRMTGDLYLGDVGQSRYEEIDYAPAGSVGLNFGWATYEGIANCPTASRPLRSGSVATPPIFTADRQGTGPFSDYMAITGGVVYRGRAIPSLVGTYLFGDYYGKRLGALKQCGSATSPVTPVRKSCDANFPEACLRAPSGGPSFRSLTAIVEDHAGELYFVASGNSLLKLVPR
jgi:glucose/arabinose dehydrogenase